MSYTFQVTLAGLSADVSTVTTAESAKLELGQLSYSEVETLAGRLKLLDPAAARRIDAGIIVRRGEKGWRISLHPGELRVHYSTSSLDDYWAVRDPSGLAELPPFRAAAADAIAAKSTKFVPVRKGGTMRSVAEIGGLLVVAVVLMSVALYYGTPRRKLSDPPSEYVEVKSPAEAQEIFAKIAGVYTTGTKKGNSVVTIRPDGKVSLALVGKDGKPISPAKIEGQGRAARKGSLPCILTTFGFYVVAPPEDVDNGPYRFKKVPSL